MSFHFSFTSKCKLFSPKSAVRSMIGKCGVCHSNWNSIPFQRASKAVDADGRDSQYNYICLMLNSSDDDEWMQWLTKIVKNCLKSKGDILFNFIFIYDLCFSLSIRHTYLWFDLMLLAGWLSLFEYLQIKWIINFCFVLNLFLNLMTWRVNYE